MRPARFAASFSALEASAPYPLPKRDDGRLWAIALASSLIGNALIFGVAAFASIEAAKFRQAIADATTAPVAEEQGTTVTITPDMLQPVREKADAAAAVPTPPPRTAAPDFTRTSEDQRGKRPDKPMFIGERDTEATSDKAPDPDAPEMPAQKGIAPRDETDIETTESRYRDGPLDSPSAASPGPQPGEMAPATPPATPPVPAAPPAPEAPTPDAATPADKPAETIADKASPEVPPAPELLQGPNPVDVPIPKPSPEKSLPPAPKPPSETAAKVNPDPQKPPAPAKPTAKPGDPGFTGFQRKTAIQGSISRTGRSALNVADSPLGRYQAAISRAVEQEWQRNCVRHRDFITPGFLTVRFFVQQDGKVKSVQFVGEMQTGEVQKGFTLNSIRDADIPVMPKEIRADYKDESLELIFNFYF